jgi:hypothetical protein
MKNFRTAIVILVAILMVALAEMGRTAVNRAYDYREMTAAKSLHQLTLETRAEPEGRGGTLLFGAALGVAALAYVGMVAFGFPAGREFGRSLARRRKRARPAPPAGSGPAPLPLAPRMRVLPPAETVRSLPPGYEEGRYE